MNEPLMRTESLAFRWINCQCFEIRLPNGKTIITDPCYDYPENPRDQIADVFRLRGFTTEDITACDYIILNHTHADHMSNLEELVNRFHPVVICHTGVANEIAQVCDRMMLTDLYPVDYGDTYYLDGFRLQTFHGTHKRQRFSWTESMQAPDAISQSEKLKKLHTMGSYFNMNFVITLENGFTMAFVGGNDDGMAEHLRRIRPNIAFRNKITNDMDVENVARDWFGFMQESFSQYVIPMHFEVWENRNPGFSEKTFERANALAETANLPCRMLSPKRTVWYSLCLDWMAL